MLMEPEEEKLGVLSSVPSHLMVQAVSTAASSFFAQLLCLCARIHVFVLIQYSSSPLKLGSACL